MKVNEIINEASWRDVIDAYKTHATLNKQQPASQATPGQPPENMASKLVRAKIKPLAQRLVKQWEDIEAANPHSNLDHYRRALATWLGKQLNGTVSVVGLSQVVDSTDSAKVEKYLTDYLLPDKFKIRRPPTPGPTPGPTPAPTGAPTV